MRKLVQQFRAYSLLYRRLQLLSRRYTLLFVESNKPYRRISKSKRTQPPRNTTLHNPTFKGYSKLIILNVLFLKLVYTLSLLLKMFHDYLKTRIKIRMHFCDELNLRNYLSQQEWNLTIISGFIKGM